MDEGDAGGDRQEKGGGGAGPARRRAATQGGRAPCRAAGDAGRCRRCAARWWAAPRCAARRLAAPMIPLKDDTPSARKAYVTISMIVACCLVFLWQRSLDEAAAR